MVQMASMTQAEKKTKLDGTSHVQGFGRWLFACFWEVGSCGFLLVCFKIYGMQLYIYIQFRAAVQLRAQIWIKADSKKRAVKGLKEIKHTKSEHPLCKMHILALAAKDLIYKSDVIQLLQAAVSRCLIDQSFLLDLLQQKGHRSGVEKWENLKLLTPTEVNVHRCG